MGCTASKLDNEDTVRRCKERRRLMKEIVHSRHHLSAAHSDYCHSLRLTGSSLSSFAAGEPLLSVSDQSPAIILPPRHPIQSPMMSRHYSPPPRHQHHRSDKPKLPHILSESSPNLTSNYSPMPRRHSPPPISRNFSPMPRHHSPPRSTAASIESTRSLNRDHPRRNGKSKPRLPHILSESSPNSTPRSVNGSGSGFFPIYEANANANYERTPSQASSMWNWENFYPPSPPDSEFFSRKQKIEDEKIKHEHKHDKEHHNRYDHDIRSESQSEEEETEREETEREEVQCSEWGDRDHYTETSTTSSDEDYTNDDQRSRSEIGSRSNFGSSAPVQAPKKEETFTQQTKKFPAMSKSDKSDAGSSSFSYGGGGGGGGYSENNGDMRIVVRHKDLAEIVAAIRENFDNAATAGEQVSEMLETGRAQLDRSFRQLKKTVYHSSGVLSNLSSSWSSKPPLAVKYRLDTEALVEPGGPRSLCSTLERLLAWEKKLYEEVKAREGVKIEHERKLSTLQNQEYKGGDEAKLDKTKASIKRLQSLIIVTSQAVSTTSTAITGLRDSDLVPQLAEICHGFMYMWRSMNQYHEVQNQIVQQVRGLVNRGTKGESTSDLHRQATRDLESAVSLWHSSFVRLIKYQRDFIQSLHGWLKLTFIPVNNENNHMNREPSELFDFCDEWKLALDRLPDTVASEAIKSFVNVVHVISAKQSEELKIKKRTETVSKELEKKASSLRNIEKKYYHSYSMVGIGIPDTRTENGHMLDARDPLSEKKFELASCQRRVEDEMMRHTKAVEVTRAMTLNNIQTGLPGVFQAMTSFSGLFTEALETVCTRSYAIK